MGIIIASIIDKNSLNWSLLKYIWLCSFKSNERMLCSVSVDFEVEKGEAMLSLFSSDQLITAEWLNSLFPMGWTSKSLMALTWTTVSSVKDSPHAVYLNTEVCYWRDTNKKKPEVRIAEILTFNRITLISSPQLTWLKSQLWTLFIFAEYQLGGFLQLFKSFVLTIW